MELVFNPLTSRLDFIGMTNTQIGAYLKLDCSNDPLTSGLDVAPDTDVFGSLGREFGISQTAGVIDVSCLGLVKEHYDYVALGYTGVDLTSVVYRVGGALGAIVATLTLTYAANVLQTVTRT